MVVYVDRGFKLYNSRKRKVFEIRPINMVNLLFKWRSWLSVFEPMFMRF